MQTRRDQLQAYRFQNRRALAALVTGQPNVLEPPMRRLTVTTLSGIMIAILIAIVFGVIAIIRPSAGTSWQSDSVVIVDNDNHNTYIYRDGVLHPVLNYTSAVLAVRSSSTVGQVQVSSSDIAHAKYGFEIGIPGVPNSLPAESSLISYPMSVCSVQQSRPKSGGVTARVTLHIGTTGGTTAVPSDQGVLVAAPHDPRTYLLLDGRRLQIGSTQIASVLGLNTRPVTVGTAFLDGVPEGPRLAPPAIPGARTARTSYRIAGQPQVIGTVVHVQGSDRSYLVMPDGLFGLSPLETALFTGYPQETLSLTDATSHPTPSGTEDLSSLSQLPLAVPTVDPTALQRLGVCAVYSDAADDPHLILPKRALSTYVDSSAGQSGTSSAGMADKVQVPSTTGMLATPAHDSTTALIISDQGVKYAFADSSLLSGFGYSASDVVKVPSALLTLMPSGPTALSRPAALARVTP